MDTKQSKQPQKQGGNKNKRSYQNFNKSAPSQISDNLLKKIKREIDESQTNKLAYLDSLNQLAGSKRFDISTNGKSNI